MLKIFLLLASLAPLVPSLQPTSPPSPTAPAVAGGTLVQTGGVFTGVFQGSRSLDIPVTVDGFAPKQGKLRRVEIDFDVRMSGEYTIQPTPVPPNGTVESHSTTTLVLDGKALTSVSLDFAPIPWIYPVNFPLSVLWALDGSDAAAFTDKATLRSFTSKKPLKLTASIDVTAKVAPAGWASPHVQGVLATWEIRYIFD